MAIYGAQPMLPLPDEMAMRQSEQASALQSAQARMGGLGQMPPGSGGGAEARPTFSGVMQQRRQQAETLQARQGDLQVAERMMQLLDPRVPKPARQFLFRELSRQIGVDPKGDQAKEIGAMVTALDPQSLEALRRSLATRIQQSQPGEITEFARGILTGQVPITELMTPAAGEPSAGREGVINLTSAGAEGASASPSTGGGPGALTPGSAPFPGRMSLGGAGLAGTLGQDAGTAITPTQGPGTGGLGTVGQTVGPRQGPPLQLPPGATPVSAAPRAPEAATPPLLREVLPELAEILGLDSTQRMRNIDVIRGAGFRRIPTDQANQHKMANDIRTMQDGLVSTIISGNALYRLIDGRPDALNLSLGRLPLLGEITLPNPSSTIVQIRDFFQGFARSLGLEAGSVGQDPETAGRVSQLARELSSHIGNLFSRQLRIKGIDDPTLQDAATRNAQIQSLLINLAFSMAAAQGQTGRNLSDRDLELQLLALGRSANPEQFQASIRTTMHRLYGQYLDRTQAQVGKVIPLGHAIPTELIQAVSEGPVTPPHLITQLSGDPTRGAPRIIPPEEAVPRALPEEAATGNDFGAIFREMQAGAAISRLRGRQTSREAQGPPAPGPEARAPLRSTVIASSPTLAEEEAAGRRRSEEDRAAVLAARGQAARQLEIAESQEARAARTEVRSVEEQRRQRIRDAFAQVAAAFRSSTSARGSAGIISSPSGDQDPNAFRLQPSPQRRAPTPIDASKFR